MKTGKITSINLKSRTIFTIVLLLGFTSGIFFSSFVNMPSLKKNLLGTKKVAQIGIIVKDIETASASYASLLGVEKPEIVMAENPADNPTTYKGKLSNGSCKLAFFNLDNMQLELIEPVGEPSTWKEYLDETGGGIHHIGFWIKDMDKKLKDLEILGIKEVQHGGWTGGQYCYAEAPDDMGIILELLENFNE